MHTSGCYNNQPIMPQNNVGAQRRIPGTPVRVERAARRGVTGGVGIWFV